MHAVVDLVFIYHHDRPLPKSIRTYNTVPGLPHPATYLGSSVQRFRYLTILTNTMGYV